MSLNVALLVAAGRGRRFGTELPKQYHMLRGEPVLRHTVQAFLSHPEIDAVRVVIGPDDRSFHDVALAGLPVLEPVFGGASRQDSVRLGLESLAAGQGQPATDIVLIHDAARPLIDAETISRVIASAKSGQPAIAALQVVDTLKRAEQDQALIADTVDRGGLWRAQTPQGFAFADILEAHQKAAADGRSDLTDDAAVIELVGRKVALVPGHENNLKITAREDLDRAAALLDLRDTGPDGTTAPTLQTVFRCGKGFDVHAFEAGDSVRICGVDIPHSHKLSGHSDADVAMHALTDALLGAIGAGDIGTHFPPTDMRWKGADSEQFLRHAADLVAVRGAKIVNLDVTVICERPKMGPHRPAMVKRLADILGLRPDQVSVKATTTEKLGFTGRQEGIAADAVVSLALLEKL